MYKLLYLIVLIRNVLGGDRGDWSNPTVFNIGGVLSSNQSEKYFKETIDVR